jgi:hypothetical protein
MKDRKGPGMMTVSTAGEGGLAEPMFGWSDREAALTALPEQAEEQRHRPKKAERKMATVRRGHFIMGYLFKNLRASLCSPSVRNETTRVERGCTREPS